MRGVATLYAYACEEEGCLTNSALLDYFRQVDIAEEEADPAAAYPTVLDLRQNYLGDAGAAACFRALALMRWVRRVEAAGIGAGPQAMRALCALLRLRLPLATQTLGDAADSGSAGRLMPSMAVLPLEYVDLRANPLFARSARELGEALKARQRWLREASRFATQPAPHILVWIDLVGLPATTAHTLAALNDASVRLLAQDAAARELEEITAQQQLFCDTATHRPTGEALVYRIPEVLPAGFRAATRASKCEAMYDTGNEDLVALVKEINADMEAYLVAYRCFTALPAAGGPVPSPTGTHTVSSSSRLAAAQACVDYGADALRYLPSTNALLWHSGGSTTTGKVLRNVGLLLRGLSANPALEEEAVPKRGAILRHYIQHMKNMYHQVRMAHCQEKHVDEEQLSALRAIYYRVVSALVAHPLDDVPSMAHVEERIGELHYLLVDCMFDGVTLKELETRQRALRYEDFELVLATMNLRGKRDGTEKVLAWPTWCAQMKYLAHNEAAACEAWRAAFEPQHASPDDDIASASASSSSGPVREPSTATDAVSAVPAACRACGVCTCDVITACAASDTLDGAVVPLSPSAPLRRADDHSRRLPRPCPACCHDAVQLFHGFLKDPHTAQRAALFAPIRAALPMEFRLFLLDMLVRCRSSHGAGAYVPTLFTNPSSLAAVRAAGDAHLAPGAAKSGSHPLGTVVDIVAYVNGERKRLVELVNAFAEWYRLRMVEAFDPAGVSISAAALHKATATMAAAASDCGVPPDAAVEEAGTRAGMTWPVDC